ncbi:aminotransferase class IV [Pinibacter soli]|uniref:branched-chain-amino-acid transaminase n=1 Tax=Pinibacter soli TaxID=3044211 RepID=A0ABT6RC19_9BACT|nr:aminotransferase class IV [Pinibacter soli]MDI3320053.1 aminotransferase class IV [Pinibacter soli]
MLHFISHNGKILKDDKAIITADNRSFRYGDGLFETMKVIDGKIQLEEYHFDRLLKGIELLQFDVPSYFSPEYFSKQITELCQQNQQHKLARVRLMVFRGNGTVYEMENNFPNYIIQTWKLTDNFNEFNNEGLSIDIYQNARKAIDSFANCKSNNYLPYIMGALYAKKQQLNDAIILNTKDRICDTTIANVFLVKDGAVITPSLQEGCVDGVMRRWLLKCLPSIDIEVKENEVEANDVLTADEVFLTNSIYGLQWVEKCGGKIYSNKIAKKIFESCIQPLNVNEEITA